MSIRALHRHKWIPNQWFLSTSPALLPISDFPRLMKVAVVVGKQKWANGWGGWLVLLQWCSSSSSTKPAEQAEQRDRERGKNKPPPKKTQRENKRLGTWWIGGYIELVHTGHSSSSCTLLVCAAADDVFRPNVRSGFFDSTSDSSVLDGVSPSSLMGDSGMSIFKFPGAIQLSSTTITTTLSTTLVSSLTLPHPNFLPRELPSSSANSS